MPGMTKTNIGPQLRRGGVAEPFSAGGGDPTIPVRGACEACTGHSCGLYLGWIQSYRFVSTGDTERAKAVSPRGVASTSESPDPQADARGGHRGAQGVATPRADATAGHT
jgi:hypothetical protein